MQKKYNPSRLFQNPHVQSVSASIKLRRPVVLFQSRKMLRRSCSRVMDCGDGNRLQGFYSAHNRGPNDLVILIHGWEGSSDSVYLISAAGYLYSKGFDVFRLNLRDHGGTHHLNRGLFHSCRIGEVTGAVKAAGNIFPRRRLLLGGFSLGGNFALRVAVQASRNGMPLDRVVAVSPVFNPVKTMDVLETGPMIYHRYFLKKWKRSLTRKNRVFPELSDLENLSRFPTLGAMTEFFAPRYTGFPTAEEYLAGYDITGPALKELKVPSRIISAEDDPVIPAEDLDRLALNGCLKVDRLPFGGHCGFFEDFRFRSWAVERMAEFFQNHSSD